MDTKKGLKTLLIILAFISARAIAITPTDDTFVDEVNPSTVNGSSPSLIVRCMNLGYVELDTLIKFDLTNVPVEATIKTAMLNLYYFHWSDLNPTGRQLDIYRITQDWSEDTTTWDSRPNYNNTAIDSISAPASYGWVQWDVTSSAQDFRNGTYPNYGWQIMDVESSGNSMIYFRSNNYNADPNLRPYLEITTNIIYVDQNATGANDGLSWTDAYNYLQDALNKPPTAGDQIWVATGTYKPDQGGGETPGDRTATFQLINNVEIYGGFAGNETASNQRDWKNNVTILSGDIGVTDINSDNSYNIVTGSSTNSTALIDGFTITEGNANGFPSYDIGGGMYNNGSGSPTVTNCAFSDNSASSNGGGMYNKSSSSPTVTNCAFSDNSAGSEGGGMYNNDNSSPTVANCTFSNNSAGSEGGGMSNGDNSSPTVANCTFSENSAGLCGAGMVNAFSNPILTNCIFSSNHTNGWGGGIYNDHSNATLINCAFNDNVAEFAGGGMDNCNDSDTILTNCTFSGNTADTTGGIYNYNASNATLTNCILWGNSDSGGSDESAQIDGVSPTVTFSCIQDINSNDANIPFGGAANNNIDDDPLFVDAANGDLRLSLGSPCIEVGSNATETTSLDIGGHPRFIDGDCDGTAVVDMGAYEFDWIYLGDLDGDCDVDFKDFGIFSSNWLAGK